MPIYEYCCTKCGRKNEFITFRVSEPMNTLCHFCGSTDLVRLVSRVRVKVSEETRFEHLADPARWRHLDENNPASLAKFMKTIGQEIGDELEKDVNDIIEESMDKGFSDTSKEIEGPTHTTSDKL